MQKLPTTVTYCVARNKSDETACDFSRAYETQNLTYASIAFSQNAHNFEPFSK